MRVYKPLFLRPHGVFSANSLAKIYAMLANHGQWQGQTLITPEVFESLSKIQYKKRDRYYAFTDALALGLSPCSNFRKSLVKVLVIWVLMALVPGADPQRDLSFAYTHNFPTGSFTGDYRLMGLDSGNAYAVQTKYLQDAKAGFKILGIRTEIGEMSKICYFPAQF